MLFHRRQSTAAALPVAKRKDDMPALSGEVIPPAMTADVAPAGKALDTDDLFILIAAMSVAWLIAVWSYAQRQSWGFGLVLLVWSVGMVTFILLLVFIQSRTWLQTLAAWLHSWNEHYRIRVQAQVMRYYYDTEREREQIREDARVKIAEIQERLRLSAQAEMVAQVEAHSQPQITMNQVANYVAPGEPEPFRDELRERLLAYLLSLYEGGLGDDGRITGRVLWSARGDLTERERERVIEMFRQVRHTSPNGWIVRQAENKYWYLNTQRYATPGQLVRAFDSVLTPV